MAMYKRDGFPSEVTEDKSNQWSERDLNSRHPHSNPTPSPLSHATPLTVKLITAHLFTSTNITVSFIIIFVHKKQRVREYTVEMEM